jgi:hypothetical protein
MKPFCEIGQLAHPCLRSRSHQGSDAFVVDVIRIDQCEQHIDVEQ